MMYDVCSMHIIGLVDNNMIVIRFIKETTDTVGWISSLRPLYVYILIHMLAFYVLYSNYVSVY